MKNLFIVCLLCIGITVLALTAKATETPEAPQDDLVINNIKGQSKRNISVMFNHSSHEDYDCVDCHHKTKKSDTPQSCTTCHKNFKTAPLKGYKSYFRAMHYKPSNKKRNSCLSCHVKEFGNDSEMTGCVNSVCHPKGIK